MNFLPSNFDPISFLGLTKDSITHKDADQLKGELNKSIIEYVIIKLVDQLTEEQVKTFITKESPEEKIKTLNNFIPDLDQKIVEELENFRKEYNND